MEEKTRLEKARSEKALLEKTRLKKIAELRKNASLRGEPVLREASFALLLKIVKEKRPNRILEVGTNEGLSGAAMLSVSESSRLTGIEIDEDKIKKAKENYALLGVEKRAKIFWGDAGEVIPALTGEYDFIFLDGPKGHYHEYLPELLRVLKVGGTLFADNVLFRGYVDGSVKTPHRFATTKHGMENYLRAVTESENLKTEIYRIEDGVSVTEKIR